MTKTVAVLTIGHSSHSYEHFRELIAAYRVSAVADVRSAPYSRRFPQFNREDLKAELAIDKIAYVYLGDLLGGRPKRKELFLRGAADYEAMAKLPEFQVGLERVIEGAQKYTIALMCSEREPLECHRCLLVARALKSRGVAVAHILSDGRLCDHEILEEQLLTVAGNPKEDLFVPRQERLDAAYREQTLRVAYQDEPQVEGSA